MEYLSNLLVGIDQLGNAVAGGNPDNTISSRVGYYTEKHYQSDQIPIKWTIFKKLINFSFYPIDGEDHCKEAYYNDAGEEFDEGTSDIAIAILTIIIVPTCLAIAILLYILYALRIVSPKQINRTDNIKHRLVIAEAKLRGVYTELNEYKIEVDQELEDIVDETQDRIEDISSKIDGMLNLEKRFMAYKRDK